MPSDFINDESSTARLTSHAGPMLGDPKIRNTVISTANAIAERIGVPVLAIHVSDDSVEVVLACDEVAALGFAAELRRLTESWHQSKFHSTLWGKPPPEEGEEWKRA
ncbi:MAG: hypothetical protein KGS45_09620 [Planctomycetes bacterium]|nr:hypothetical protein [Planctomycetota bacterium]